MKGHHALFENLPARSVNVTPDGEMRDRSVQRITHLVEQHPIAGQPDFQRTGGFGHDGFQQFMDDGVVVVRRHLRFRQRCVRNSRNHLRVSTVE